MRTKQLLIATLLSLGLTANAANEKTTVSQVTDAVTLSTNTDYIITGKSPFATAGSINIANTEHAVVILKDIKPSKVTSAILSHIYINGQPAVAGDLTSNNSKAGSNCQVRMYNQGSIILPYAQDFKPLTVYSEQNFEGETYNTYTEGSSGGFMKSLTANQFNNKIRSFKLKRGYMVTFAVGTGGWGYSRCFIADQEDLEIASLPAILDQRISSYRLFKWWNSAKKGVHDTSASTNNDLNTTWAFDWGQGNESLLPDVEWVPNHIYEDWPSAATCGGVIGSCHMKTNNEPANSADDHPQDVATVLANWQNLMRTGMRLCSPATHDGGWGWHNEFMKAIDERGWRCDIVDFHGYWDGEWGSLDWRIDTYAFGRPVWFSEWLWGASWNRNGAFAEGRQNDNSTYDGTKPVLERLNSNSRVERYAYWNSEAWYTKIHRDGSLTKLGQYYSEMDAGLGYNAAIQKVPNEWRLCDSKGEPLSSTNNKFSDLACTYDKKTGTVKLDWTDRNGDLMQNITVQCKLPNTTTWTTIATIAAKDQNSANGATYTYTDYVEEPGVYTYRVMANPYKSTTTKYYTEEGTANVAPAQGTSEIQFGKLSLDNTESNKIEYSEAFDAVPCVFIGAISNSNTSLKAGNNTAATNTRTNFTYQLLPWQSNTGSLSKNEEIPFLALKEGNYKYDDLDCEVGVSRSGKASGTDLWTDVAEVTFKQPFPEGVTPVVLAEVRKPSYTTASSTQKATTLNVRVFDITNTGFKYIIYPEDAAARKVAIQQTVCYLAITPGIGTVDKENGILIAAGQGKQPIYGSTTRANAFLMDTFDENGDSIKSDTLRFMNPTVLAQLQTNNYPTAMMLRRTNISQKVEDKNWTIGVNMKRIAEHEYYTAEGEKISSTSTIEKYSAYRDYMGWVALSVFTEGASEPTAIQSTQLDKATNFQLRPRVVDGSIYVDGVKDFEVYSASGKKVSSKGQQTPGLYLIKRGEKVAKIIVK